MEMDYGNCKALYEIQQIWSSQINEMTDAGQYSAIQQKRSSYRQPVAQPPKPLQPQNKPKPPPKAPKKKNPSGNDYEQLSQPNNPAPTVRNEYEIIQPLQVAPARNQNTAPKPPPRNRNSNAAAASALEASLQNSSSSGPRKPPAGAFNYMMAGQLPVKPTPPPKNNSSGPAKETFI